MVETGSLARFYTNLNHLDQRGSIIAEYVWIDGSGITLRCKARTLTSLPKTVDEIPRWNFDGSSCYMASTHNSEVILKPVAFYPDPFREGQNIIVLCSTYVWGDESYQTLVPANTNFRHFAEPIFEAGMFELPWFGIE
jgi:glutamine synthetase